VIDTHRICERFQIAEARVPGRLIGSKASDIDFTKDYEIQLISVKRNVEEKNILGTIRQTKQTLGLLDPTVDFRTGDTVILFGESKKIKNFLMLG
jgi:Trk K+ transport system NAD-binding subunit